MILTGEGQNKNGPASGVSKTWMVMKLMIALLLFFTFQANAGGYAQSITIVKKNVHLLDVFKAIEQQTNYLFFFDRKQIQQTNPIDIELRNATIEQSLAACVKDNQLSYSIIRNTIVVRKDRPAQPGVTSMANDSALLPPGEISGRVVNSAGDPVQGVSVFITGTRIGTTTGNDGRFTLVYPDTESKITLEFSSVGYQSRNIAVSGDADLNIVLQEVETELSDVVVVGYGTQRKIDLTGSVASVKGEELVKSPAASTVNTLAGRLPGLVAKQTSGQPGFDQSRFNIRNFGSALIIVDGAEQSFNNIDPNEIESISILKDASAAIYGSRAGNGVILVTTKRGASGKTSVKLNSTVTGQAYTNFTETVNAGQYATLIREAQLNSGIPEAQVKYSEEDIAKYFAGTDPQFPNTDWMDVIMRKWAPQHQHNVSISGGNEKAKYYTFLGYLNQDGMFRGDNTGYERYNVRSNMDVFFTKDLTMSLDLSAIKEKVRQSNRPASDVWFWMDFFDSKPTAPSSFPDPTRVPHIGPGPYNAIINTHEALGGYDKTLKTSLNGSFALKYNVSAVKGLEAKFKVNYFQYGEDRKTWTKQNEIWDYDYASDTYTLYGRSEPTTLNQSYNANQVLTGQLSLGYNRSFNRHSVNALALYEVIDYSGKNFSAFRQNYISTALDQLFAGGTIDQRANGNASGSGRESYVGRVNYSYAGKYLLQATIRHDGSPIFARGNRWGTFPGISAGWRLSEESFLKNTAPWLSELKLRGGISQTGYDGVPAFQYLTGYQFSGYYVINGQEVPALNTTGLANPNITWETMTLSNIGLDFSFFNGRLYGQADVFQRVRADMLGSKISALPSTFGASLPSENINSQQSRGFEFVLGNRGGNGEFQYDVSANISYARSKWKYYEEVEYTDPDDIRIHQRTGQWTDMQFGYKSDGLFTSQDEIDKLTYDMDNAGNTTLRPGDIKLVDLNDDGKIDWRDYTVINNGGTPHLMYGINAQLFYKGFDLSLLVQGAGNYTVQLQSGNINIDSERTPYKVIWNERWTPENNDKNAIIPRQKLSQTTNNWNSDYWNRNASFARLKNVNLGYSFNSALLQRAHIDRLRLFVSATNLFTINPLEKYGLDPESPDATRGWTYPIQRTVSIGLNVNF